jgi:hypothetical protein
MPPDLLAKALPTGISASDWYRFLNRFVFLWADRERAERHGRAFSRRPQVRLRIGMDSNYVLGEDLNPISASVFHDFHAVSRGISIRVGNLRKVAEEKL